MYTALFRVGVCVGGGGGAFFHWQVDDCSGALTTGSAKLQCYTFVTMYLKVTGGGGGGGGGGSRGHPACWQDHQADVGTGQGVLRRG